MSNGDEQAKLQTFLQEYAGGATEKGMRRGLAQLSYERGLPYAHWLEQIPTAPVKTSIVNQGLPQPYEVAIPKGVMYANPISSFGGGSSQIRNLYRRSKVNKKRSIGVTRSFKATRSSKTKSLEAQKANESPKSGTSKGKARRNPVWLKKWQFKKGGKR